VKDVNTKYKFRSRKALKAAAESIAATDAAKNFGQLVDPVRESGATYVIERHGRPVAQIGPVETDKPKTLSGPVEYLKTAPKLDQEVLATSRRVSRSTTVRKCRRTRGDASRHQRPDRGGARRHRHAQVLVAHGDQTIAIATICVSGSVARRASDAERHGESAERNIESLLARFAVVDFDLEIARLHARLDADLAAKGTAIGAHDLIIAATALSLDYRVATRDKRSFPNIAGLNVVYW
jgi:tRNA(fMet)-specific endonuclease VapC